MLTSILIYFKENDPKTKHCCDRINTWSSQLGATVVNQVRISQPDAAKEQAFVESLKKAPPDLIIVVGGDGTLLSAVRVLYPIQTPILAINTGKVGFLMSLASDHVTDTLTELSATTDWQFDQRTLLEVSIRDQIKYALNDVVLGQFGPARLIELTVTINKQHLSTQRADAILVSTPTGSTAYNLSAGGPIIHPATDCLVITPISPNYLSSRPFVVRSDTTVALSAPNVKSDLILAIDGHSMIPLNPTDEVQIRQAVQPLNLVRTKFTSPYLETLRNKLHWQ
jgi:NAD+ kinase